MINQVGLPYHVWHTIAQSFIMDRIPVKVSVIGTQLFELNNLQGGIKTAADFENLHELEKVDNYLTSLIQSK